jgi:hypothetical protein
METVGDTFQCPVCGGEVRPSKAEGRTRMYRRGAPDMAIPADFAIPTCDQCGERYFDDELVKALEPYLRDEFLKWQAKHLRELVDILTQRNGVSKAKVAGVCGITPSHLSHLIVGSSLSSPTLQRLLEAFVMEEQEFKRQLSGIPMPTTDCYPFGVQAPFTTYVNTGAPGATVVFAPESRDWIQKGTPAANDNVAHKAAAMVPV